MMDYTQMAIKKYFSGEYLTAGVKTKQMPTYLQEKFFKIKSHDTRLSTKLPAVSSISPSSSLPEAVCAFESVAPLPSLHLPNSWLVKLAAALASFQAALRTELGGIELAVVAFCQIKYFFQVVFK